jgi:hypothetical protein
MDFDFTEFAHFDNDHADFSYVRNEAVQGRPVQSGPGSIQPAMLILTYIFLFVFRILA